MLIYEEQRDPFFHIVAFISLNENPKKIAIAFLHTEILELPPWIS